jgi:uncharacterized membrane protein
LIGKLNASTVNIHGEVNIAIDETNPLSNIQEMGFITQEDLTDIGENEKVAVYMPLSYSLSGKLIIVPKEQIKPIKMNPTDAMKFIVSGGLTDIDK